MLLTNLSFLTKKNLRLIFLFINTLLLSSCMTSSRQDELQGSINRLEGKVNKLQGQLTSKDKQINNTTQTILSSQNDVQSLRDQLQLTQGAVDEIKNKIKKIEENSGTSANANAADVVNINNNDAPISMLQKQIARLELVSTLPLTSLRKGKMPLKVKSLETLNKLLKSDFDKENYKQIIDLCTGILMARDATDQMLATALESRGEAKFQLQDYKGAAIDLASVTQFFSQVPKKGRALLLAGDSYVYLKNNSVALLYYQEGAKSFANTPEGKAAAARLSSLNAQINSQK